MNKNSLIKALLFWFMLSFLSLSHAQEKAPIPGIRGIYVTQYNLENTSFLNHLIKHAKASGINTFVVDLQVPSKRYRDNIALLKENNLRYVARIVVFPDGGTAQQVASPDYWQKRYSLVKQAIDYGASSIQLDYIRYNTKQPASSENAKNIHEIIKWYKTKLASQGILLEVDVFGIAAFGESKHIGHNIKLFSESIDAVCPMVYPSHFSPFKKHFNAPYDTIYDSLASIQDQFGDEMPIKLYAYIELSNYHYSMSRDKTIDYIKAQLQAVKDVEADGWYAWSPHNRYDNLFSVLESQNNLAQK